MMDDYYKCTGCGTCCKSFNLPVKNKDELIKTFEETYGFKLTSYDIVVTFRGKCEHLENNKCKNYDARSPLCKQYFCKYHCKEKILEGQLYKKRCRACGNIRTFQKGKERDKQSVCGNCWVW